MARFIVALVFALSATGCIKDEVTASGKCDMEKIRSENQAKLTISQGVYGTVELITGDCMPSTGGPTRCFRCPAKRTVQLYEYTNVTQAVRSAIPPYFWERFNTQKLAEVEADEKGFFEISIGPGKYSLVSIEDGKIYVDVYDPAGGINPVVVQSNKALKVNLAVDKAFH